MQGNVAEASLVRLWLFGLTLAGCVALPLSAAAGVGMDDDNWQALANIMARPDIALGLATDMAVMFANFFWAKLEDVWLAIGLIAALLLAGGVATGMLANRMYVVWRSAGVYIIVTLGMQTMPHSTYADLAREQGVQVRTDIQTVEQSAPSGASINGAPILIEVPTRIYMQIHQLFGSVVYQAFGEGYLKDNSRIAFQAISTLNNRSAARVLSRGKGELAHAWLVYQNSCTAVPQASDHQFTAFERRTFGFGGAGMSVNPAVRYGDRGPASSDSVSRAALQAMGNYVPNIVAFARDGASSGAVGDALVVSHTGSDTGSHPQKYGAYRIPSAQYWRNRLMANPSTASSVEGDFLMAPGAEGGNPDWSIWRFDQNNPGRSFAQSYVHDRYVDFRVYDKNNNRSEKGKSYWMPVNCLEFYQMLQTGFNHYYAGSATAQAAGAGENNKCVLDGLEAILKSHTGTRAQEPAARGYDLKSIDTRERAREILNQFSNSADSCPSSSGDQQFESGNDIYFTNDPHYSRLPNQQGAARAKIVNSVAESQTRRASAMMSKVADTDNWFEAGIKNIHDFVSSITESVGTFTKYFSLSRNIPLLKGTLSLLYGVTIMAFPFMAGLSVLPGYTNLLTFPLKLLAFVHVTMFALYLVLQAAGFASAALVVAIAKTPNTETLISGPFMKMLAALPLMAHFVVLIVLTLCWRLVFGGMERGAGGASAGAAPGAPAQQSGAQTIKTTSNVAASTTMGAAGAGYGARAAGAMGQSRAAGAFRGGIYGAKNKNLPRVQDVTSRGGGGGGGGGSSSSGESGGDDDQGSGGSAGAPSTTASAGANKLARDRSRFQNRNRRNLGYGQNNRGR